MKINIKESFLSPFKSPGWLVKMLIGGALFIVPILNFFSMGYLMRVFKNAIFKGEKQLPNWDDFGSLFIQGLFVALIGMAYFLPIILVIFIGLMFQVVIPAIGALIWILTSSVASCIAFAMPFIIGRYLETGKFQSIFDVHIIFNNIKHVIVDYLKVFLLLLIVNILSVIILGLIPGIGLFLWFFVMFYIGIVFFNIWGELYPVSQTQDVSIKAGQETVNAKPGNKDN